LGGARAISVLTEPSGFGGSIEDLRAVADTVQVPVLRKDFLFDPTQVLEALVAGAAAVLLIARFLADEQLAELVETATAIGVGSLVEIHDDRELERALALAQAPTAIGVNARDLSTFRVDLRAIEHLLTQIPPEIPAVAESGVAVHGDVVSLAAAGADAVLVGTAIARSADPETTVRELTGVPRRGR
jgi:indole-3-glycerol phosphate synthase